MPIRFACEACGHPIEVDDRFAGLTGHCKHCGHHTAVPRHSNVAPMADSKTTRSDPPGPLRLRPLATDGENDVADPRLAAGPELRFRALAPHEDPTALEADDPDESHKKGVAPPAVLDPDHRDRVQASRFHLNPHYETRFARLVARVLRTLRDWLYVISIVFLVAVLYGYALSVKKLMHLGIVGVIATNIGMLVVGLFYLITLPFKDSLAKGLGTLLFPPYAVYYWVTHWPRMKVPVVKTLRSFTPILLAGLAYFFYKEAPVIEKEADLVIEKVEEVFKDDSEAPPEKGERAPRPGTRSERRRTPGDEKPPFE